MSEYVTNAAWPVAPGRADAIDDVADQFERPTAARPWVGEPVTDQQTRWPRSSGGWRSQERMHARAVERQPAEIMRR